jgi:hypothetical protein
MRNINFVLPLSSNFNCKTAALSQSPVSDLTLHMSLQVPKARAINLQIIGDNGKISVLDGGC